MSETQYSARSVLITRDGRQRNILVCGGDPLPGSLQLLGIKETSFRYRYRRKSSKTRLGCALCQHSLGRLFWCKHVLMVHSVLHSFLLFSDWAV
ncbi:hypothetical protein DUNSADRAFT_4416 [Dunaliella salina]|uniref:Encoded protein n=1 Tax=Dunaliella salina TaxID=3046 RepID=A0ABQ7GS81_DUNSA|nr:hypothetical protein DUNSADRAFT_4416 [Dunaliella salina]|eukprot:KAF5837437.1 hypothetical protein DUNSADRAFT_4416 [Dunaliella salina]